MPDDAAPLTISPCRFMDTLIDLLGGFPAGPNKKRAEALSELLSLLDRDARQHDAPPTTIAAIKGAQILLGLGEMPASPPPLVEAFRVDVPRAKHLRLITTQRPSAWEDGKQ